MKKSIIHVYIYGCIRGGKIPGVPKPIHIGTIIERKRIEAIIGFYTQIPKKYYKTLVKEMVELRMLKRLNRDKFEILQLRKNPLTDSRGNPLW
jgi:hypothetical protein